MPLQTHQKKMSKKISILVPSLWRNEKNGTVAQLSINNFAAIKKQQERFKLWWSSHVPCSIQCLSYLRGETLSAASLLMLTSLLARKSKKTFLSFRQNSERVWRVGKMTLSALPFQRHSIKLEGVSDIGELRKRKKDSFLHHRLHRMSRDTSTLW